MSFQDSEPSSKDRVVGPFFQMAMNMHGWNKWGVTITTETSPGMILQVTLQKTIFPTTFGMGYVSLWEATP